MMYYELLHLAMLLPSGSVLFYNEPFSWRIFWEHMCNQLELCFWAGIFVSRMQIEHGLNAPRCIQMFTDILLLKTIIVLL